MANAEGLHLLCSQDETSEMFIGEWAEKRGIRDQLVIATKVCKYSAAMSALMLILCTRSILMLISVLLPSTSRSTTLATVSRL